MVKNRYDYVALAAPKKMLRLSEQVTYLVISVFFLFISAKELSPSFKNFDVVNTKVDDFIISLFQSKPAVMSIFFLCLIFSAVVISNIFKCKTLSNKKLQHPNSPWKWDYEWNPSGHIISIRKKLFLNFFALIFIVLIIALVIYFYEKQPPMTFIEILLFSVIILIPILYVSYNILKALKFSNVSCLYKHFPFKISHKLKVEISGLPSTKTSYEVKLELRYLERQIIEVGSAGRKRTEIRYMELFKETTLLKSQSINNRKLYAEIPTPERPDYTTDLTRERPRYWELRVSADVPGIDYDFGFLIPLYK